MEKQTRVKFARTLNDALASNLDRCPLWVISGHSREDQGCPLYPQQRTCSGPAQRVRFVPQADIAAVLLAQSMEYQRLAIPYLGAGEVYRQNSLVVVHRTIIGSCQRPIRSDFAASAASASAGSGGSFGRAFSFGQLRTQDHLELAGHLFSQCQLALHATDEPGKRGGRSLVLERGNP